MQPNVNGSAEVEIQTKGVLLIKMTMQISSGNLTVAVIEACTGLTYFRCFADSESDDYEMEFVAVQYGQETQKSKCVILLFLGISGITH